MKNVKTESEIIKKFWKWSYGVSLHDCCVGTTSSKIIFSTNFDCVYSIAADKSIALNIKNYFLDFGAINEYEKTAGSIVYLYKKQQPKSNKVYVNAAFCK